MNCYVQAGNIPSEKDVWSPTYHLKYSGIRNENDQISSKVEILRKFIENGKLSRQANFERYVDQLFVMLIDGEAAKDKMTPEQFSMNIEKFQYVTKADDEEDDEKDKEVKEMKKMMEIEMNSPIKENETRSARIEDVKEDVRRPPQYPLTGKCNI